MDGTLVDSEPIHHATNKILYKDLGITISDEEYEKFIGIDSKAKWSYIKEKSDLPQSLEELMELSKSYKFKALSNSNLQAFDGIDYIIQFLLEKGITIALASSSSWKLIELDLEKTGLDKYFPIKVSGQDIANGKPAPDIFLKAASLINKAPNACLVIEDSTNGVKGANAAGMTTVGFKEVHSKQDLSAADLIINSYQEADRAKLFNLIFGKSPAL